MSPGHLAAAALVLSSVLFLSAPSQMGAESSPADTATSPRPPDAATPEPSAQPGTASRLQSVAVRGENARTVEVVTSILGVELGSTLEEAHTRFDKLSDPATPPKVEAQKGSENTGRGTRKVLWQFAETDYRAVFIKTDDKQRIASINAIVRPGKEQPFDKIGEVEKAPIRSEAQVAWDVIRPGRPLFRVVAQGTEGKASTINIFLVKRDEQPNE